MKFFKVKYLAAAVCVSVLGSTTLVAQGMSGIVDQAKGGAVSLAQDQCGELQCLDYLKEVGLDEATIEQLKLTKPTIIEMHQAYKDSGISAAFIVLIAHVSEADPSQVATVTTTLLNKMGVKMPPLLVKVIETHVPEMITAYNNGGDTTTAKVTAALQKLVFLYATQSLTSLGLDQSFANALIPVLENLSIENVKSLLNEIKVAYQGETGTINKTMATGFVILNYLKQNDQSSNLVLLFNKMILSAGVDPAIASVAVENVDKIVSTYNATEGDASDKSTATIKFMIGLYAIDSLVKITGIPEPTAAALVSMLGSVKLDDVKNVISEAEVAYRSQEQTPNKIMAATFVILDYVKQQDPDNLENNFKAAAAALNIDSQIASIVLKNLDTIITTYNETSGPATVKANAAIVAIGQAYASDVLAQVGVPTKVADALVKYVGNVNFDELKTLVGDAKEAYKTAKTSSDKTISATFVILDYVYNKDPEQAKQMVTSVMEQASVPSGLTAIIMAQMSELINTYNNTSGSTAVKSKAVLAKVMADYIRDIARTALVDHMNLPESVVEVIIAYMGDVDASNVMDTFKQAKAAYDGEAVSLYKVPAAMFVFVDYVYQKNPSTVIDMINAVSKPAGIPPFLTNIMTTNLDMFMQAYKDAGSKDVTKQLVMLVSIESLINAGFSKDYAKLFVSVVVEIAGTTAAIQAELTEIQAIYKDNKKKIRPVVEHVVNKYSSDTVVTACNKGVSAGLLKSGHCDAIKSLISILDNINGEIRQAAQCGTALGEFGAVWGSIGGCGASAVFAGGAACPATAKVLGDKFAKELLEEGGKCALQESAEHVLNNFSDPTAAAQIPMHQIVPNCTAEALKNAQDSLAQTFFKDMWDKCAVYFELAGKYIAEGAVFVFEEGLAPGAKIVLNDGLKPALDNTLYAAGVAGKEISEKAEMVQDFFEDDVKKVLGRGLSTGATVAYNSIETVAESMTTLVNGMKENISEQFNSLMKGANEALSLAQEHAAKLVAGAEDAARALEDQAKLAAQHATAAAKAIAGVSDDAKEAAIDAAYEAAGIAESSVSALKSGIANLQSQVAVLKHFSGLQIDNVSKFAEQNADKVLNALQEGYLESAEAIVAQANQLVNNAVNVANTIADNVEKAAKAAIDTANKALDSFQNAAQAGWDWFSGGITSGFGLW